MEDLDSELEMAVAELAFWLDYAKWWRSRHHGSEAPRVGELLECAEMRYAQAKALSGNASPCEKEDTRRKPILMEVK